MLNKSSFGLPLALLLSVVATTTFSIGGLARSVALTTPKTYCNPMNLDYAFVPDKDYAKNNAHRSTADPVCILYKDTYYLFSTNQEGYWWSKDLASWNFVSHFFKVNSSNDQVCAPAAWPSSKGVLFLPCIGEHDVMPLYVSKDPRGGKWEEATGKFPLQTWDPTLFEDDDGKLYVYWGSSNFYPMYGAELDPETYQVKGAVQEMLRLDPKKHGWEQFGENNQNGKMDPFMEGAWMNKFNGKYYLQYGAPGTEWNVYGDGVYVSDKPLGPFVYQLNSPFSWKPGGFACGAGHGATFEDKFKNVWHVGTMVISVKNTFERRIGLFPAGVDKDGVLFADTAFGDYPQLLPNGPRDPHKTFAGWYLLSYNKKVAASDNADSANLAFDENIKTYWTAGSSKPGQYLQVDLGKAMSVNAIQINYADDKASFYGKQLGNHRAHRYKIWYSDDGTRWIALVDKSHNSKEVPHDYVELSQPLTTRYLKLENVSMPTGNFAISDFRVFGSGGEKAPAAVQDFSVSRDASDKRNVNFSWQPVDGAYAYELSFGVSPDKLYNSMLVYNKTKLELHSLNVDAPYYFRIQSVNENGISAPSELVEAK